MKKFLASTMIAVTALSFVADAFARPVGGGRSFGRQSQSVRQMRGGQPLAEFRSGIGALLSEYT